MSTSQTFGRAAALIVLGCSALQPLTTATLAAEQVVVLEELLRIGAARHDLSAVGDVARSPDGRIWIGQPQDGRILGFSASGTLQVAMGRRGEGPGEFRELGQIGATDSEVHAWQKGPRQLTVVDGAGKVIRTQRLEQPGSAPRGILTWFGVESILYSYSDAEGTTTDPAPLVRYHRIPRVSTFRENTVVAPRRRCSVAERTARGMRALNVPLCARTHATLSPNGRRLAVIDSWTGAGSETGVKVKSFGADGTLVHAGDYALGRSPIPRSVHDSVIVRMRAASGSWNPALAGEVWVTTRSGSDGARGLLVVGGDGTLRGRTPLPQGARLGWAGDGHVVIVEEDADGLQDVVLYRVTGG